MPAEKVNPKAVEMMQEVGIDIGGHIMSEFRRVRDEIKERFYEFYKSEIK